MNFKRSFNELKNPLVWAHYGLGTIGIVAVFWLLMNLNIITAEASIITYAIAFFITYVIIDRASHAILKLY